MRGGGREGQTGERQTQKEPARDKDKQEAGQTQGDEGKASLGGPGVRSRTSHCRRERVALAPPGQARSRDAPGVPSVLPPAHSGLARCGVARGCSGPGRTSCGRRWEVGEGGRTHGRRWRGRPLLAPVLCTEFKGTQEGHSGDPSG